jgi:hypothetical protein
VDRDRTARWPVQRRHRVRLARCRASTAPKAIHGALCMGGCDRNSTGPRIDAPNLGRRFACRHAPDRRGNASRSGRDPRLLRSSVRRHVAAGRRRARPQRYKHRALTQAEVEALEVELYPWRRHWHVQDAYWVVGRRAAAIHGAFGRRPENGDRT